MFPYWSLTAIELQKSKQSRSILELIQSLLKLMKTLPQIFNQAINVHCNVSMCSLLNINDEGPCLFLAGMERTTCGTIATSKRRYSHITLAECLSDWSELPFKLCSEEFISWNQDISLLKIRLLICSFINLSSLGNSIKINKYSTLVIRLLSILLTPQ